MRKGPSLILNPAVAPKAANVEGRIRRYAGYCRIQRRERYCLEQVKLQPSNLQAIANAEDRLRDFPEDVTDEFKQALKLLKDSWIHISALACPNSSAINQEKPKERICAPFS